MHEKEAFLAAAVEIGELLRKAAIEDRRQVSWKVVDKITKVASYENNDIYTGNSGMGLFFLELYKHTKRAVYLRMARKAILTAATREQARQPAPSFICGRLGVAFAMAKLYETTGTRAHRTQALQLAKSCRGVFSPRQEYISGNAGNLLAVLHIHAICKQPWLLGMANEYTAHILNRVRRDMVGIYWDRGPYQIRPLCGFSHGVSGIGFALLETGRYVKNPALYKVAEQAFRYENNHFDQASHNWFDFRLEMWKPEQIARLEAAYMRGETAALTKPKLMLAWCHGAPGIGLSRIAAYQLTRNKIYQQDISNALLATRELELHDLSLCHGMVGNLEVFIENYLASGRVSDKKLVQDLGERLLQRAQAVSLAMRNGTIKDKDLDLTLFTGLAGLGYTMLRLHDPQLTTSILSPRLPTTLQRKPGKKLAALRITENEVQALLSDGNSVDPASLQQLKRHLLGNQPSDGLLFIRQLVNQKAALTLLKLTDKQLLAYTLRLDADCFLHFSPENNGFYLLRYTPNGVEQRAISQFCYSVLASLTKPQKVQDMIDKLARSYKVSADQRTVLHAKALEQTRQALHACILIKT